MKKFIGIKKPRVIINYLRDSFDKNDLLLVAIEKVEGSPIDFLQRRYHKSVESLSKKEERVFRTMCKLSKKLRCKKAWFSDLIELAFKAGATDMAMALHCASVYAENCD